MVFTEVVVKNLLIGRLGGQGKLTQSWMKETQKATSADYSGQGHGGHFQGEKYSMVKSKALDSQGLTQCQGVDTLQIQNILSESEGDLTSSLQMRTQNSEPYTLPYPYSQNQPSNLIHPSIHCSSRPTETIE